MFRVSDAWPLIGREHHLDEFRRLVLDPRCVAILFHGAAGVGKSRLADECRTVASGLGCSVARVTASEAAASLPLGALAAVLPTDLPASASPRELLDRALAEFSELSGPGARLVLMVDDAHLMDNASAALLTQLLEADAVFLIATIRDGEPQPDAVASWWRNDRTTRIDLVDLDEAGTGAVLDAVLDGLAARDTVARLHQASSGNPLYLRELVIGATVSGRLDDATGAWRLSGDPAPTPRLHDLLTRRLAVTTEAQRRVLETIAVCQPVGIAELASLADEAELEVMERDGFITVVADGRRQQVLLAHPIYGEVLRGGLTVIGRRRALLTVADRVEALGARRREDPLRIATWRLEAGAALDPELLARAARIARFANDFAHVQLLTQLIVDDGPSHEARVLLGEAHYELGDFAAAEAVLGGPLDWSIDPDLCTQQVLTRAKNLQWGLGDAAAALAVIDEAVRGAPVDQTGSLRAGESSVLVFSGRPQAALDVIDTINVDNDRLQVGVALNAATALAMVGRPDEGVDTAVAGYQLHNSLPDPQGLAHPGTHIINQVFALIEAGRFAEAEELALLGHGVAVADRVPIAQIWFALDLARSIAFRGHHREALRWYHEASSTARANAFDGPLRVALSGAAASDAAIGDIAGGAAALAEIEGLAAYGFLHHEQVLAPAWMAWATGDPVRARTLLVDGARQAVRDLNRAAAGWLWHDAARLGAPGVGVELEALAAASTSPLIAARAAHVVALDAGDAAGLDAASVTFEELGLDLLAAEAASAAAEWFRRSGDQRAGTRASQRALELAARCPGVRTPGMFSSDAPTPLSAREREIATLAGQGLSSPDIAVRLYLSVRTVNNHLQHAYTKLGVTGREQLAVALGSG